MGASQPMPMQPGPNEKSIKAFFVSTVHDYEAATVIFPRVMSVRSSEFTIKEGLAATLRVPMGQFEFYVDTIFPGQGKAVRVSANVVGAQVDSLTIEQKQVHNVLINIRHTASASPEYCTVTCEATGESRTGAGACIDCKGPKGTVRLCC